MFARFNENPAMTLQDIKETKRYGRMDERTDGCTDGRTDGQRENSIPPTNKVCGGYNHNLENFTCEPFKCPMGSPILIVSICMGKSIRIQRVNDVLMNHSAVPYQSMCTCLFALLLYVPGNSYGHGRTVSSPNHTFSWASLNKR